MLHLDSYFSTKVDDFDSLDPDSDIMFPLDITVGWENEIGTTDFFLFVCNKSAFKKNHEFLSKQKTIVIDREPHQDMIKTINEMLDLCSEDNFWASCNNLAKIFDWEYTDYKISDN
jgi:hypothetical protein